MTVEGLPYGIIDPEYAAFFTVARLTAWQDGYALALHGSFTRDLDLIAVPWTDAACDPTKLIKQVEMRTEWKRLKEESSNKEHGRLVWTMVTGKFGNPRFVDFSIMPPKR